MHPLVFIVPFFCLLFLICGAFILQIRKDEKNSMRLALKLKSQAYRAQTNPHIIANALTAIRDCYHVGGMEKGDRYLVSFSRLMRSILHHSGEEYVSIGRDLDTVELFLQLEQLRRPEIRWDIRREEIPEAIKIPPLLIQPLVENSLQHAIADESLQIEIILSQRGDLIHCEVRDNGILGRKKASHSPDLPRGYGTSLIRQRLQTYQQHLGLDTDFHQGPTEVGYVSTLTFPFQHSTTKPTDK